MNEGMFSIAVSKVEEMRATSPEMAGFVQVITKESTDPSLSSLRVPNAGGAIIQAKAASLWPYKFVAWILKDLIKNGFLNLQTNTPVTRLQKAGESEWIVHTPEGIISSPTVLLCTNAYTSALVPGFSDLIVPGKPSLLPDRKR
jgi:glycine/D-amino acid oxidase-like deaminating enzyme